MSVTTIDLKKTPIDVTDHIHKFVKLLNTSWPCIEELIAHHDWDEDGDFTTDIKQALWLLLVERELLGSRGRLRGLTEDKRSFSKEDNWDKIFAIEAKWDHPLLNCRTQEPVSPEGMWTVMDFYHLHHEENYRTVRECFPFDVACIGRLSDRSLEYVFLKDLRFYLENAPKPTF